MNFVALDLRICCQSKEIEFQEHGKWNFLMKYIFQEEEKRTKEFWIIVVFQKKKKTEVLENLL